MLLVSPLTGGIEMQTSNRKYTRSKISIAAELIPEQGEAIQVMVKDLSLRGIMVHSEQELQVGEQYRIRILLGHYEQGLPITAKGCVVRVNEGDIGIEFDCVGIEETEELERTILAKSKNPEQCMKEITQTSLFFDPLSANDFDPTDPR